MSDNTDGDFTLPLQWKQRLPPNQKFTIADDPTLTKILSSTARRPQPEFQSKEYVRGVKTEEQKVFNCAEPGCSGKFTTETSLKLHLSAHRDRHVRCSFCTVIFKTEEEKVNHAEKFHPDLEKNPEADPLQCKKCNRICRDRKALWRHVRETHRDRDQNYACLQCNIQLSAPDNLRRHLKLKHPPEGVPVQKWTCDICDKTYVERPTLMRHIKLNHRGKEEAFRCVLCDSIYDNRASYNRHMKRHVDPKWYPCELCNVRYGQLSHLKRHFGTKLHKEAAKKLGNGDSDVVVGTKIGKNNVKAMEPETGNCQSQTEQGNGQEAFTKQELINLCKSKYVKIILHRVDSKTVQQSSSSSASQAFEKKKSNLYLNCIYCNKSLPDLEGVKKHEMLCFKEIKSTKLHVCPYCKKEFGNACRLAEHSRIHSVDRPFPCSYCDLKFKIKLTKVQHEKRMHFGIRYKPKVPRVFCCNHQGCSKQFSTDRYLMFHVAAVHLGISYPCKSCGMVFKREDRLRRHVKLDHDNPVRLPCKVCKTTLKSKRDLLKHFTSEAHQRNAKELCRQFGNKEEMTAVLSGKA